MWRLPAVRRPAQVLHDLLASTVDSPVVRDWIKHAVEAPAHPCLPSNPRRLKGLANLIGRLAPRLPSQEGESDDAEALIEAQLLVIVACIHQFHPDLYVRWEADFALYDKIRVWCEAVETPDDTAEPGEEPPPSFLQSLTLPLQRATPEPTDPAIEEFESTFPDPTEANVFWIQSLVLHLGRAATPDRFERYLHGVPA